MWERSRRQRTSVLPDGYTLVAWNNRILSLHSRLTASINLGDARNLPCPKLHDQDWLLELYTITHCSKQLRSLALFSFSPDIKQKGDEFDPTSTYIRAAGHRAPLKQQAGRGGKRFWFVETSEKSATAGRVLERDTHRLFPAQARAPVTDVSRPGLKASPLDLAEAPLLNFSLPGGGHVSSRAVVILCLLVAFPKC